MDNCIFCKIISREIPSEITFEDEDFIAFLDIQPKAPGHTLLLPKEHHQWFQDLPDELGDQLFRRAKMLAQKLKGEYKADYIHLSIVGKDVPHVHVHLIPSKI
jgi:histidine triad (HIT) family protein